MWPFSRKSTKYDPEKDLPDLTGKVAIVTGGNGIGFAAVQHLARRGARVYLAARSEERAKAAIERLRAEGLGKGEVEWWELDLAKPKGVKHSAERFLQKETRLDILVNNAGILRRPYHIEPEGVQDIMLVNHFGPFIFTRTFLPLLSETAKDPADDVRVVMLGSDSVKTIKSREIHFRNLDDFNEEFRGLYDEDFMRYGKSKLANILFAKALQKHLDDDNIPVTVLAVDPGWVWTHGVATMGMMNNPIMKLIMNILRVFAFVEPREGAFSSVVAAAGPAVRADREKYKGKFLVYDAARGGVLASPLAPQGESAELAEELWNGSIEVLKGMGL